MRALVFLLLLTCGCRKEGTDSVEAPITPVFNEVVALNFEGLTDEAGDPEDWIELYNPTSDAVDLTDWSMTDALGTVVPWAFPDGVVVEPGDHLVVFCDAEPEEGDLHTDFELTVQGEAVVLLDADGVFMDELRFGILMPDLGWGRVPDGGATWEWRQEPTPGEAN